MATIRKKVCKNGVWISRWKFLSNKNPFNNKMTVVEMLQMQEKIVEYLRTYLHDRELWAKIKVDYKRLQFDPEWFYTPKTNYMIFHLKVVVSESMAAPGNTIVTPPPPRQPPPPRL